MWNGVTMFANNRRWLHGLAGWAALALAASALALEPGAPAKIEFLPPPMEGTLSLGIYDATGKLVRVLHREADISELTAGVDGLITQWDGKNDQGAPCPTGSYRARGVMVGELSVEGVDFIGNDWVTDNDSPRVRRITGLGISGNETPFIAAILSGQSVPSYFSVVLKPAVTPGDDPEAQLVREPQMPSVKIFKRLPSVVPSSVKQAAFGAKGTTWGIDGDAVKQYSAKGEILRSVAAQAGDPIPVKLTASTTEDKVYVLYENADLQRLRGYDFTKIKPGAEPKELFENDIAASDRYEQIASQLKFPDEKPFVPSPVLTVALVANPLANNKPGTLQIRASVDKEGSYLATTDGLPLCRISETKALLWAVIGQAPGTKALTLFDSDGAVVEEFQIANPANMMTFDAGAIEWTAVAPPPLPSASPTASPAATPSVAPTATPAQTPVASSPSPAP